MALHGSCVRFRGNVDSSQERAMNMTNDTGLKHAVQTPANNFPTESFDDAVAAVTRLSAIYEANTSFLRDAFARYRRNERFTHRVRACYPFVRVRTEVNTQIDSRRSYGFVAGPGHLRDDAHAARSVRRLLSRAVAAAGEEPSRRHRSRRVGAADSDSLRVRRGHPSRRRSRSRAPARDARHVRYAGPRAARRPHRQRHVRAACRASRIRSRCSRRRASISRCIG